MSVRSFEAECCPIKKFYSEAYCRTEGFNHWHFATLVLFDREQLTVLFRCHTHHRQTHVVALRRLTQWSPKGFGLALFGALNEELSSDALLSVSEKDLQIMLTADSELYNMELLERYSRWRFTLV